MGDAPQLTKEQQSQFASWPAGVLDAIMMPAPVDDEVHAPARILDLWAIPSHEEVEAFDMESPLLGWNGDAPDLHTFLKVFVQITGTSTEEWPPERFDPLVEYLLSLRAPKDLSMTLGIQTPRWVKHCSRARVVLSVIMARVDRAEISIPMRKLVPMTHICIWAIQASPVKHAAA